MREYTILAIKSENNNIYKLLSTKLNFKIINQILSDYYYDNKSFWQIIHERNENFFQLIKLIENLKILDLKNDGKKFITHDKILSFNEELFPDLWIIIVNKIIPDADIKMEEFSPIYL